LERSFDLVVVGAGPAGASCARRAAELGLSVAVLEKDVFPRAKPCAAGLPAAGLARVGAIALPALHREFRTVEIVLGDRTTLVWTGAEVCIATTTREELDAALADAARSAGARIEFGTRVESLSGDAEGVKVDAGGRAWLAPFLVAADGARGAVRGLTGAPGGRVSGAVYVNAFPPQPGGSTLQYDRITFDLRGSHRGYGWVFPKRDHLCVGVYSQRPLSRVLTDDLRAFVASRGLVSSRTEGPYAFPVPAGGRGWSAASGRVLFAGDAAGLADPVTGEGIRHAVESGRAAAEEVALALSGGGDAGAAYARRVARDVLPEVRLLSRIGNAFYAIGPAASDRLLSIPPVRSGLMRLGPWQRLASGTGRLSVETTARARAQ